MNITITRCGGTIDVQGDLKEFIEKVESRTDLCGGKHFINVVSNERSYNNNLYVQTLQLQLIRLSIIQRIWNALVGLFVESNISSADYVYSSLANTRLGIFGVKVLSKRDIIINELKSILSAQKK